MTKHARGFLALSLPTAAVLLGGLGAATSTGQGRTVPFPVAELFFELNDSAGDLGIHANIDGGRGPLWKSTTPAVATCSPLSARAACATKP